jgi:hypothetical protein
VFFCKANFTQFERTHAQQSHPPGSKCFPSSCLFQSLMDEKDVSHLVHPNFGGATVLELGGRVIGWLMHRQSLYTSRKENVT